MMVNLAKNEGKIFYATSKKHEFNGGGWALGLREITPTLKTGDFYSGWESLTVELPVNGASTRLRISTPVIRLRHCIPH